MLPPRTLFMVWLDRDDTRFIRKRCAHGVRPSEYLRRLIHEERRLGIENERKYWREWKAQQDRLTSLIWGVAARKDEEASPEFKGEMLSPKAHMVKNPPKKKVGYPRGRPRLKGTK